MGKVSPRMEGAYLSFLGVREWRDRKECGGGEGGERGCRQEVSGRGPGNEGVLMAFLM